MSPSLLLEADGVRDRTQSVLHRLLAIATWGTDGVQLTSWDAWPAAGHARSAAVSYTPRQYPAAGTLWHTRSTGGYARLMPRTPDSTPRTGYSSCCSHRSVKSDWVAWVWNILNGDDRKNWVALSVARNFCSGLVWKVFWCAVGLGGEMSGYAKKRGKRPGEMSVFRQQHHFNWLWNL